MKTRKIKLNLNSIQRSIFRKWFGANRFLYNKTIDKCKSGEICTKNKFAAWTHNKTELIKSEKWLNNIPYQIQSLAIYEAIHNHSEMMKRRTDDGKQRKIGFKSKKNTHDSLYIPKSAVKEKGIYARLIGSLQYTEKLPQIKNDCRLSYDRIENSYYICIPIEISKSVLTNNIENQDIVALDPGDANFMSFYSEKLAGNISGRNEIYHLFNKLDYWISICDKLPKNKKMQKKKITRHHIDKYRNKIKNYINDIHWKTVAFLTKNYKHILIPVFETQKISQKMNLSKNKRSLLTWSHYLFRMRLLHKARENGSSVYIVTEEYTSKTCTRCGNMKTKDEMKQVKADGPYKCPNCFLTINRDINGARNIFLKNVKSISGLGCAQSSKSVE